ncbi:MAG: hypothetical protein A3J67_00220 [Parcubacteria group bacterium RIFCSPHIGHO2_02_FULL_48_10b]|nr:MAG: hypothetical protein A3J67_00220 [Parcubacteria group bacterium RIFCSPHIGHO2_02_FULL_48_10b]
MKAVILGAGLGTRLQHLITNIPKVMVPFGGKPLLLHIIERLKVQGFNEFIVNLHYYPDVITDFFGDGSKFGVSIQYSYEQELLESAGAIKKMEQWLTEDFVLIYGDTYFTIDVRELVKIKHTTNAFGVISVKHTQHLSQADVLEVDLATNRVIKTHSRPHNITELREGLYSSSPLYCWSSEILNFIPLDRKVHLDREIVPKLLEAGKILYARPLREGETVIDVGKPDNYQKVLELFGKQ